MKKRILTVITGLFLISNLAYAVNASEEVGIKGDCEKIHESNNNRKKSDDTSSRERKATQQTKTTGE